MTKRNDSWKKKEYTVLSTNSSSGTLLNLDENENENRNKKIIDDDQKKLLTQKKGKKDSKESKIMENTVGNSVEECSVSDKECSSSLGDGSGMTTGDSFGDDEDDHR